MNFSEFPYIKIRLDKNNLIDNIKDFYIKNEKEETLEHVIAVAQTNSQIAEKFGMDKEKCYLGGLLHDISAAMEPEDMMLYAKKSGWVIDESEKRYPFLLHQQFSKLFSKEIFKIEDEDILSPVNYHTTLKKSPSKYDMALFIADKLSWDQEGIPPFFDVVNGSVRLFL